MKQRTISKEVSASGVSLHSGENVMITLKPTDANQGVVFRRIDLEGSPEVKADYSLVTDLVRNTTLATNTVKVSTVEHILSALTGCGVDNVIVELNGSEPPIFDGSAQPFVDLILDAKPVDLGQERAFFEIDETIAIEEGDRSLVVVPYDGFKITCTFADRKGKFTQNITIDINTDTYLSEIAKARTFTFYEDIEALIKQGKIKGGSLDSAIVIKDDKVMVKEPLRFDDELVRHKVLDVIGDLSLLGMPIKGHVIANKPGHAINTKLTAKIASILNRKSVRKSKTVKTQTLEKDPVMDIQKVLDLLPHRYPFLLIDRVIEVREKEITAVKNVTVNEPHFMGHFPEQPVMPGVLQIEAMAQAAGLLMLETIGVNDKLALFMSCDKVKFRKIVTPGDQLIIKAELLKTRGNKMGFAKATCYVDDTAVSSAELTFALVDKQ